MKIHGAMGDYRPTDWVLQRYAKRSLREALEFSL